MWLIFVCFVTHFYKNHQLVIGSKLQGNYFSNDQNHLDRNCEHRLDTFRSLSPL